MPRELQPSIIAFPHELRKGAFIVLPEREEVKGGKAGETTAKGPPQILRFQYNPETITRNRTGAWDVRKNQKDPGKSSAQAQAGQSSFRGGGLYSKAETIAMKLVFDATELMLRQPPAEEGEGSTSDDDPAELGVLPELAVLERVALAEPPADDKKKDPKEAQKETKLNALHPKELLLVLGKRYFPVIVTSMNIVEKRFNPQLVPMRAEVDLQMQVLEATAVAGDPAALAAYKQLVEMRERHAAIAAAGGPSLGTLVDDKGNIASAAATAIAEALTQKPGPDPDAFPGGGGA